MIDLLLAYSRAQKKPFRRRLSNTPLQFIILCILLISACREEPTITSVNFEEEEFADFVEPDFPYITTSMDARALGAGFPDDNISARSIALRLGNDAYACFDTDMLRWSVAWTGDFLPMVTMAQISYNDFYEKKNRIPVIGGDPQLATGLYPGWFGQNPDFSDPRPPAPDPESPSWGPIPEDIGRWNGIYVLGNETVMSYVVKGTDVFEKPGSLVKDGVTAFTRTFRIAPSGESLSMVAAEIREGSNAENQGKKALVYRDGRYTGAVLSGNTQGVELQVIDDRYLVMQLAPGDEDREFTLILLQAPEGREDLLDKMASGVMPEMPDFQKGGKSLWSEKVLTRGQLSPDTAAYVTDMLTLPVPNPWSRNVRVVDVAFFDGNKAALVTFEGDVWLVDGIDDKLRRLEWRRYASGLYEPQSIEVKDGEIYVFGKEGIVKFHDLNGDGEADYYENFSHLMAQSIETREWASDMVAAPDGSFYVAKFGALDMGPETSSPKRITGFRDGSQHAGSILKVSADGRSIETYASGFRGPYMGIHPETGIISASDQQGNYMPSTPVMLVKKGDYYGVPATAHREDVEDLAITPTTVWIPHAEDRSGISQVWLTGNKMGPLNNQLIHFSYGRPGLFRVMLDSTSRGLQGAVSVIDAHYPAPTMKGAVNPLDGQLYITGFSLWGHNSNTLSAFLRLRYTGKESVFPEKFQAREGGIMLRFGTELDESTATDVSNYAVKRWNYQRTEKYGSGHFKPDGSVGEEHLPVLGAYLSNDRKALFLAVPEMEKVMQMELAYRLKTAKGKDVKDVLWLTVNDLDQPDLLAEGFGEVDWISLVANYDPAMALHGKEEAATTVRGEELFVKMGCIACHAVDGKGDGKIGPGMKGLLGSERQFKDGSNAIADEDYIRESIVAPGEKVVKGFEGEMPSFLGVISDGDLESLVMYIRSL
ncbi:DUF6797 domain-containing protein [Negadavirga shengliensis]|uniref:DUF6797 domain-containing protein n=1 Tax=Negadavirga shengliensis TaxID=1389218 RepID=A0ABV9SZ87_9BACT